MQIQLPGGSPRFELALAERQGWTIGFAERVAGEYRRFLYLAATAGFEVTPSRAVDEAWHLHLAAPHYRDVLCRQIVGRPLEHRAANGEPGEAERHRRQYEETLDLYESVFGTPPADIWPSPTGAEEDPESEGSGGRRFLYRAALVSLAGSAAALAFGVRELAVALLIAAVLFFLFGLAAPAAARRRDGGSGCGGGCGGGGGGKDGGGDSSCGGGCGGD